MNPSPLVSTIIVSYNTRQLTLDCLRTLYAELGERPNEVWIVDNASQDGSVAAIEAEFPDVKIIANTQNTGFGTANNQAMEKAAGEWFLLLNSDAFPKPGAIGALLDCGAQHPKAGVIGPRLLNKDGSLQKSCWRFPSPARTWLEALGVCAMMPNHAVVGDYYRWAHDAEREVDWVSGACMMVRREAYQQTGGFDSSFFMYAEESDWQKRIRDAGWTVMFTPDAQVTHLGSASASVPEKRRDQFFGGLDHFTRKHYGSRGLIALRVGSGLGSLARAVAFGALSLHPKRRERAREQRRFHVWIARRQFSRNAK